MQPCEASACLDRRVPDLRLATAGFTLVPGLLSAAECAAVARSLEREGRGVFTHASDGILERLQVVRVHVDDCSSGPEALPYGLAWGEARRGPG